MEFKKSDYNALEKFMTHIGKVFRDAPGLPPETSTRTCNAYRLSKKEFKRALEAIEKLNHGK